MAKRKTFLELKVAQWLDENSYIWNRNKDRFQYINLKGDISHCTPDFLLRN